MSNPHQFPNGFSKLQRGQAMVLIALAFIGLAAFIGLTVDAGILFIQIGHLRRAVDAASLAGANQFREGRTPPEIEAAADEFINLNSLNPATAQIFICDWDNPVPYPGNTNPYHDINLCPEDDNGDGKYDDSTPRKFVRVEATMPVEFAFLPIIGWGSVDIRADATSETASVDIVLVIDRSQSMAYDAECGDGDDDDVYWEGGDPGDEKDDCDDVDGAVPQAGDYPDNYGRDPDICNDPDPTPGIQGKCKPFEDVRKAAIELAKRMYFPYDRLAIVTFDKEATRVEAFTSDTDTIMTALGGLTVFKLTGAMGCEWMESGDPTNCTNTNIADGLFVGGKEFHENFRQEAVPILILLSDGAANAATDEDGLFICPGGLKATPTWVEPFCHDQDFEVGEGAFGPDAEDRAVEAALYVGCPDEISFPLRKAADPPTTSCDTWGQGAVIFTIGLGDEVINDEQCDDAEADPYAVPPILLDGVYYPDGCQENQGEELLRYIAGIGDDGDPSSINDCEDADIGEDCGNYYFAPTGSDLIPVFEAIASRIFTRIVH